MRVKIGKYPDGSSSRKIDIKIDKYDSYSADHTLAMIILPVLMQLKATKHGIPSAFADVGGETWHEQLSFEFYEATVDECFDIGVKRWEDTLDKMIWAFEQLVKDNYDEQYHHGEPQYDLRESDRLLPNPITGVMEPTYQMIDLNPTMHWTDYEGMRLHEEKIQEGLDLFGKYYRNLWD